MADRDVVYARAKMAAARKSTRGSVMMLLAVCFVWAGMLYYGRVDAPNPDAERVCILSACSMIGWGASTVVGAFMDRVLAYIDWDVAGGR